MSPIIDFLLGNLVGGAVVGFSVQRTLSVHYGNVRGSVISSVGNSIAYFFSVLWIARDNHVAYLGTAVGSTIVVVYMALKNRKKAAIDEDLGGD